MTLNEYDELITAAEKAGIPSEPTARHLAIATLRKTASGLRLALWQPGYRQQASALALRADALADEIDAAEREREIAAADRATCGYRDCANPATTKTVAGNLNVEACDEHAKPEYLDR